MGVEPDPLADRSRFCGQVDSQVPGAVGLACLQGRRCCSSGRRIHIAVQRRGVAGILWADRVACGRHKLHCIVARRQVFKQVAPILVRCSRCHHSPTGVEQLHGHPSHTALPDILDAILVGVVPDAVPDCGRRFSQVDPQIPGAVCLPHTQARHHCLSSCRVDVAVICAAVCVLVVAVGAASILRADQVPGWRHKLDGIAGWFQVFEQVIAIGVGLLFGHQIALGVVQLCGDSRHAAFIGILKPVFVRVVPHTISARRRSPDSKVHRQVGELVGIAVVDRLCA